MKWIVLILFSILTTVVGPNLSPCRLPRQALAPRIPGLSPRVGLHARSGGATQGITRVFAFRATAIVKVIGATRPRGNTCPNLRLWKTMQTK